MARRASQHGAALIAVLWVGLFLGLLSVGLVATGRIAAMQGRNTAELLRLELLADAAIETAAAQLLGGGVVTGINGEASTLRLGGIAIQLRIQDALGLIDINQAPVEVLQRLFIALGLPEAQAQALTDSIADWRDGDDLRRLHGAEREDYIAAGRRYLPRNRGFERVDELRHVHGMTPALLLRIAEYLTVHGGPIVDLDAASPFVARVASGMDDTALADRQGQQAGVRSVVAPGRAYRVEARSVQTRMAIRKIAWLRLTGSPERPFWVLDSTREMLP
ncbi:general secretion pathway protein GspK [Ferrovibrio sp.]|uniref:general secretion pathway protein GspK n=1 Tax=Ferrovibrio sp. TaxID=1917215 RepID=UPI003D095AD6